MSSINEALNKARKARETADKSYALPLSRISDETKPVKRKGSVLILGTILGLGVFALGIIRYGSYLPLDYFNFWRLPQVSRTTPGGQAAAPTRTQAASSSSTAALEPRPVPSASDAAGPDQAPGSVPPEGFQMVSSAPEKQDPDSPAGQPQAGASKTAAALSGQSLPAGSQKPVDGGAAIDGRDNVPVFSSPDATGHAAAKNNTRPDPASKSAPAPSGGISEEPLAAGLPGTAAGGKDPRRSVSRSAVPAGTQLYNKAVDLEAKGETRQAQVLYRQAVAVDPTLHQALVNLANLVFVNQHDHHQAIELYRRALKLESKNPRVHNNLGIVYLKQGDIDAAKMEFDQAITLNPGYADAYYNSACLAVQQGDIREGMSLLKKTASLDIEVAKSARNDPDLKKLRDLPEFKTIINPTR